MDQAPTSALTTRLDRDLDRRLARLARRTAEAAVTRSGRAAASALDALDAFIRRQAIVVKAVPRSNPGPVGAADAAVLAEAAAAAADVLVSGDQDLLGAPDLPIKVVSPRTLWELICRAP